MAGAARGILIHLQLANEVLEMFSVGAALQELLYNASARPHPVCKKCGAETFGNPAVGVADVDQVFEECSASLVLPA